MKQQGGALVITLIFTLLISIAATSAIKLATHNSAFSSNYIAKQRSFFAAETLMAQAVSALQGMSFNHGCDVADANCFINRFADDCVNGFCFSGQYQLLAGELSCAVQDERLATPLYQNDAMWANAVSNEHGKYLIEFRCYRMKSGAAGQVVKPLPDGATWDAVYRISTLGTSGNARTLLQQNYFLAGVVTPGINGLFSVNKQMNVYDGSQVVAYYCERCDESAIEDGVTGNFNSILFDVATTPSVAHGSDLIYWHDSMGEYVQGSAPLLAEDQVIGGALGSGQYDGSEAFYNSAQQIGEQMGNDYFASYFGTRDRDTIYNHAASTTIAAADFEDFDIAALGATFESPKIVVIEGDLSIDYLADHRDRTGSEFVTYIVKGDVTITSAYASEFALMYVEGDLNWSNGAQNMVGTVAVEGDANLRTSIGIRPKLDPSALLANLGINTDVIWQRSSWHSIDLLF